jgi:peptidoglycan/LPS O-acetylase OafA/YrhL
MRRSAAATDQAADRLPFLEGIRGLLALYVVLGHLCSMADPTILNGRTSHAPDWLRIVMAPFAYGHLAVAGFIVISGFCLQLSLFGSANGRVQDVRRFYARRARRILPPYYACLAFSILVSLTVTSRMPGMPFDMYLPVTNENVLAHVFLVHNLSLDWMYKLNGVLWSIAIEVQLYIIFPLLVVFVERFGRLWTVFVTGGVACIAMAMIPDAPKLYPWYLPLFVGGMTAAHLAFRPSLQSGVRPAAGIALTAAAALACGWACSTETSLATRDALAGWAIAALSYALTVSQEGLLARGFSMRPLVVLGGFSYSLYLMHHPIQQVLYSVKPAGIVGEAASLGYLLAVLPVIVLGTWLFSLVFERPFLPKRQTAPPAPEDRFVPLELPLRVVTSATQAETVVRGSARVWLKPATDAPEGVRTESPALPA